MDRDETLHAPQGQRGRKHTLDRFEQLAAAISRRRNEQPFPGGVDMIREARAIRDADQDDWLNLRRCRPGRRAGIPGA